jgi:tetratricopeptide (TPR) repeat protein
MSRGLCYGIIFMATVFAAAVSAHPAVGAPPSPDRERAAGLARAVVDRLWQDSDRYWHDGRYEDRIGLDYLLIEIEPDFVDAYGTTSVLLISQGRRREAEALLHRFVKLNPERWESWFELGRFMFDEKRYAEAAQALQTATTKPRCWVKVYHSLAHAYQRMGDLKKSLATWEEAKRREPDDQVVDTNLKRVRSLLERGH